MCVDFDPCIILTRALFFPNKTALLDEVFCPPPPSSFISCVGVGHGEKFFYDRQRYKMGFRPPI